MDHNTLIVTGTCSWHKEYHKDGLTFGSIKTKISLPKFEFNFRGDHVAITNPSIWVNIGASYENNLLKRNDKVFLDKLETQKYVLIKNAKITNWISTPKDSNGNPLSGAPPVTNYTIDTKPFNVCLSERPFELLNECTFEGTVEDITESGWITVKSAFRGGMGQKEIKHRLIPVLNSKEFDPSLKGRRVLVLGKVCAVMPDRKDKLYILASNIIKT